MSVHKVYKGIRQMKGMQKIVRENYYGHYWPQLGLMSNDVMYERGADMREALKRLPQDVMDERKARLTRALFLSTRKIVLPKEEWTQPEEDVPYLLPYLEQVKKEKAEKAEWNNLVLTWKKNKN